MGEATKYMDSIGKDFDEQSIDVAVWCIVHHDEYLKINEEAFNLVRKRISETENDVKRFESDGMDEENVKYVQNAVRYMRMLCDVIGSSCGDINDLVSRYHVGGISSVMSSSWIEILTGSFVSDWFRNKRSLVKKKKIYPSVKVL